MRVLKVVQSFAGTNDKTRAGTATPWLLPCPNVLFLLPSCKAQSRLKRDQRLIKKFALLPRVSIEQSVDDGLGNHHDSGFVETVFFHDRAAADQPLSASVEQINLLRSRAPQQDGVFVERRAFGDLGDRGIDPHAMKGRVPEKVHESQGKRNPSAVTKPVEDIEGFPPGNSDFRARKFRMRRRDFRIAPERTGTELAGWL